MQPDDRRQLAELAAAQERLRGDMQRLDAAIAALRDRVKDDGLEQQSAPAAPAPVVELLSPEARPLPNSHEAPRANEPGLERESLEWMLGSVWLVRVGVVVLLTALVFLGNYVYESYIGKIGADGRLALICLAGAVLCSLGSWIERGRDSLRNYSRVLAGAGMAALYYAGYGAYFVPALKVIGSPVLEGALLLVLSAGIVWFAERKRSETLATFAILLSFYTGSVNPLAGVAVFSNLLLTAIAVVLLVRRQWTTLSFLSLLGAYAGYGFWHYFHTGKLLWITNRDPWFFYSLVTLSCYWAFFTAGLFLCKRFPPHRRLAFLSLNNGAYFGFASAAFLGNRAESYWMFPCLLGAGCIGLAWLAQRRLRDETLADGAYLAQGLLLVSIGLAAKLSGCQLALTYGLESAVLVTCSRQRHGNICTAGAVLASLAAFGIGGYRVAVDAALAFPVGGLLALLFLYNARWSKRLEPDPLGKTRFLALPAFFVALALALGLQMIDYKAPGVWQFPVLAMTAVLLAYMAPLHGLVELAVLGQLYLLGADRAWLADRIGGLAPLPWWNPALLLAATVAIAHWWGLVQAGLRISEKAGGASASSSVVGQMGYCYLALAMYVGWGTAYVPKPGLFAFFAFSAILLFEAGLFSGEVDRFRRSGLLLGVALGIFWRASGPQVSWVNTAALAALLIAYHAARRFNPGWRHLPAGVRERLAYPLLATLCLLVTRWVRLGGHGLTLTVSWSLLAALTMGSGFLLRDRSHRQAGFALLGLALGRILVVDIWSLDKGYRIASLLVLGTVLPVLGFVYNRFADRMRSFNEHS